MINRRNLFTIPAVIVWYCLVSLDVTAQFRNSGVIQFKRTVNLKQMLSSRGISYEMNSTNIPSHSSSFFTLSFNQSYGEYVFQTNDSSKYDVHNIIGNVAKHNSVYTDFANRIVAETKSINNIEYKIKDTVKNYNWKIHSDTREILGLPCRKATTTICDSIVVVAYYTAQITSQSGPESFNGLPGMILMVVIPRLFTSWTAVGFEHLEKRIYCPDGRYEFSRATFMKFLNDRILIAKLAPEHLWWASL
jgi:GLPGLI family protein